MEFKIALVQMLVTAGKDANLCRAEQLVAKAASTGAKLIILPESFNIPFGNEFVRDNAEVLDGSGRTHKLLSSLAKKHDVYIIGDIRQLFMLLTNSGS
ncbi:hypothetical protein D918_04025 [Trichuris suis]|nr:hypothetical protein D918_04025 [Trichuris suis]